MRNFQDKKKWRKIMESKPILAFLGIVVLVFAWSVFGLVGKLQETEKNKVAVEQKIAELQKNKEKLATDTARLQTDQGKEDSIREKFGWVKPGEGVIVVVDDKNPAQINTGAESSGLWGWLKNLFQ